MLMGHLVRASVRAVSGGEWKMVGEGNREFILAGGNSVSLLPYCYPPHNVNNVS